MKRSATKAEAITPAQYRAFQEAYDFFNAELFAGSLPHVLVTLQRHAKARGYFSPDRFTARTENAAAHELAMNPDSFTGRTDEEILSTLAHEMAHVWQQSHGTPPRRCYHDRPWAAKMKEIGSQASDTGQVGGKEIGQSVSHYIIPGGAYAKIYAKLQANGLQLHCSRHPQGNRRRRRKPAKRNSLARNVDRTHGRSRTRF
ncbi:MAG TPA: SprT-like domain-containing protein [Candidatus Acidoferrales bacterium]|nr:SprT-like domain-containing protein [Candidatus Acidoferrales bacterium]